jgi:opacity protein-like surface antigen
LGIAAKQEDAKTVFMNRRILTALLLLSFAWGNAFSQGKASFHAGTAIPLGDFASSDTRNEGAGGAAVGLNLGLQYKHPFAGSEAGIFAGVDVNLNGLTGKLKDELREEVDKSSYAGADLNYYEYWNIPVSLGLYLDMKADAKTKIFLDAGAVYNFLSISTMYIETNDKSYSISFDLGRKFGFRVGAGMTFSDRIYVAVDYFGMGKYTINGNAHGPGNILYFSDQQKISLITLTIGYQL